MRVQEPLTWGVLNENFEAERKLRNNSFSIQ